MPSYRTCRELFQALRRHIADPEHWVINVTVTTEGLVSRDRLVYSCRCGWQGTSTRTLSEAIEDGLPRYPSTHADLHARWFHAWLDEPRHAFENVPTEPPNEPADKVEVSPKERTLPRTRYDRGDF